MNVVLPDGRVVENVPEGTTKAQLVDKLRRNNVIDDAGAQNLLSIGQPDQPERPVLGTLGASQGEVVGRQVLKGATLGFSDEIQSVLAAAVASPFVSDKTFGQLRQDALKSLREEAKGFEQENPAAATGLQLAGGLATGGAVLKGLQASGAAVTGLKGAATTGLSVGAVAGAGSAEGGIENRAVGAVKGAAVGALFGTAVSGLGIGAGFLLQKFPVGLRSRIANIAQSSGLTPFQIERRLEALGPKAVLADVEEVFRKTGARAAKTLGSASASVQKLIARDESQFTRIMEPIRRTLGDTGGVVKTIDGLKNIRLNQSSPLYEEAFEEGIQHTARLGDLLSRPETQKAWRAVQSLGRSDPDVDVSTLVEGVTPSLRGWQAITRQLSDRIGNLQGEQKKDFADTIVRLRKAIQKELDTQSPKFAEARSIWAGTKDVDEALDLGSDFLKKSPSEIDEVFNSLTPSQQEFYRLSAGRAIEQRLSRITDSSDATTVLRNEAFRDKARSIFPDSQSADDFVKTVDGEFAKRSTTAEVSRASKQQAKDVVEKEIDTGFIQTANPLEAVNNAVQSVGTARERTIQELGDLVLSQEPQTQARALQLIREGLDNPLARVGALTPAGSNVSAQSLNR